MRNFTTTKELYDALICKPDLHSIPELHDNVLTWHLFKNAYILAYCDSYDTCIDIISTEYLNNYLTHWHPDETEMLDHLYSLGKKGNMLVLKKTMLETKVFYVGPVQSYPYPDMRQFHVGKKKWDTGQLIYFKQK